MSTENRKEYSLDDSEHPEEKGNHVAIQMNGTNGHAPGKVAHKKQFPLSSFLRKSSKKGDGKSAQSDLDLAKEVHITEHLLTFAQLESKFETSLENGLSSVEAQFRLARDGPNAFTPPKQTPNWLILFRELTGGFAWIMWFSAIASLVAFFIDDHNKDDIILAGVLVFVIFVTGLYSFSQQQSSSELFKMFRSLIPQGTVVIRDGKQVKVAADQLVLGDVVLCKGGERIPADVRIIKCEGMKVDNSSLTGEAEPLSRSPEAGHQQPLEAKNLAFFSTSCVDGSGVGVVISTGDNTVMGKIAKLVTNIKGTESPISIEIGRFVRFIAFVGITLGIVFFAICLGLKMPIFKSFVFGISIIIGNIPEGLLPAMTLALTLTAKRLASKNCLIKFLESVETLGSTSTICSDKTGTLTENRMTVEHCYLGNQIIRVSHDEEETREDMANLAHSWQAFQRTAKLCSRANFIDTNNADLFKRECTGDASETAILRFMESVSPSVEQYRQRFPKIAEKPFSSVYKYQYSVHQNTEKSSPEESEFFVAMKGAPERIIKLCSTILNSEGETVPLTEDDIDAFECAYRELGSMGERVLAFCDRDLQGIEPEHAFNLDEGNDFELKDLRFVGLVAMIDPPRASVPDAVSKCKDAGICVIMVTGDHPITAQAIAKSVGIISVSHRRSTQISLPRIDRKFSRRNMASIVVPGDELATLDEEELRDILRDFHEIVFARTSPQQKLRIVETCQSLGRIVAVTGDGVNDSPALKKADIGIAMGITGSDVSKQAADMILMDDNFASIVVGVEEGRRIFDNLKKVISYIMGGNCATIYPFLVFLIFGFPVSISAIQILCICLGTDLVPAISLAYEPAESDIMSLNPRDPKSDRLVTRNLLLWAYFQAGFIVAASGYMGFFVTLFKYEIMPWDLWQIRGDWDNKDVLYFSNKPFTIGERTSIMHEAQTAYFAAVIVVQLADVLVNKTRRVSIFKQGFGNWFLNFSIIAEIIVAACLVYIPQLNKALTFTSVGPRAWCAGLPFFFYLLAYEEGRKYIVRRYPKSFFGKELAR